MSAIITEKFRKNNTVAFLNDISDVASKYYVGLGKSDAWPVIDGLDEDDGGYGVTAPLGSYSDMTELLNNLTTLVGITSGNYSQVIPNISAKTNRRYKAFNPFDPDCFYQTVVLGTQKYPCYTVVNDNVYLCVKESSAISAPFSVPTGASTARVPVALADGSVWIYIYTMQPEYPINGAQFITVPTVPTFNGDDANTISAATGNLVYGFTVLNGGSGYTTPTVTFVPDTGSPISLTAVVSSGAITSITYAPGTIPSGWVKSKGYVKIVGAGSDAVVYPNIAPSTGFGFNPAADLPSWYAGISVAAVEDIYGDGAYIPYRQISIIKNPEYEVGTASPELSLACLKRLEFGVVDAPTAVTVGDIMTQTSTGAIGIVDHYDSANKYLYYHQNYDTGFKTFTASTITLDAATYEPTGVATSEYKKLTGEVVFTENRQKINRVGGQTEELTIILQF